MANSYFVNAQNGQISVELNSGQKHVVPALTQANPVVSLGLAATQAKDVLGTGDANTVVVTTEQVANSISWTVTMSGILPNEDIQFLVFDNCLLARQGSTVQGFSISQDSG